MHERMHLHGASPETLQSARPSAVLVQQHISEFTLKFSVVSFLQNSFSQGEFVPWRGCKSSPKLGPLCLAPERTQAPTRSLSVGSLVWCHVHCLTFFFSNLILHRRPSHTFSTTMGCLTLFTINFCFPREN